MVPKKEIKLAKTSTDLNILSSFVDRNVPLIDFTLLKNHKLPSALIDKLYQRHPTLFIEFASHPNLSDKLCWEIYRQALCQDTGDRLLILGKLFLKPNLPRKIITNISLDYLDFNELSVLIKNPNITSSILKELAGSILSDLGFANTSKNRNSFLILKKQIAAHPKTPISSLKYLISCYTGSSTIGKIAHENIENRSKNKKIEKIYCQFCLAI